MFQTDPKLPRGRRVDMFRWGSLDWFLNKGEDLHQLSAKLRRHALCQRFEHGFVLCERHNSSRVSMQVRGLPPQRRSLPASEIARFSSHKSESRSGLFSRSASTRWTA